MLATLRASLASLALQLATAAFERAMTLQSAPLEDRQRARALAMGAIARNVRGPGRGDWTVQSIGVLRATLATAAVGMVSGTAAIGTLGLACAIVGGGL